MDPTGTGRTTLAFDAFLSYARADDEGFRAALLAALEAEGIEVWFDRESLPTRGTTFDQEIRRAIQASARLVLVAGRAALSSAYVSQEWRFADDLGVPVVPVLRAGGYEDLPPELAGYHAVDARPPRPVEAVAGELVRLLSDPVPPLGRLHGVPPPAPHELERPALLDRLRTALGPDRQRPEDAGRAPRAAALYGTSGAGKSTVAASFARAVRTRRTFADGVVWIPCGPGFDPVAGARGVLALVAAGAALPDGPQEAGAALAAGLAGREVLVVLDDLREPDAAAPLLDALGPGARALITTLDEAVATALGAVDVPVEPLAGAEARVLLGGWTDGPLPEAAEAVLDATEGLPFALAIVGAMVRNRVPWERVVEALQGRRLDLLASRFPGYPHPTLLRALAASYDALAAEEPLAAACFLELAAFRPGAALTEAAMVRLWSRGGARSPLEAAMVLPVLTRRLLVLRRASADGERFHLHGLHEDFVRLECPDAAAIEAELLDSYRAEKGARPWSSLPDDGYVYEHLVEHLAAVGGRDELTSAVDGAWVRRQLVRRGDLGRALDDVRLALDAASAPPLDLGAVSRLALVTGQVSATIGEVPGALAGALAEAGEADQALRWAADKPDPGERFDALVRVADALVRRGDRALANQVVRTAVETIPGLGRTVETGMFSGLTALNAVHAIVRFPWPDQWEGTTDQLVALARVPLDAVVRVAPVAAAVGRMAQVAAVTHPFWELYGHLIPLTAVEELAEGGDTGVASALLDAIPADRGGDEDTDHAARYRRAAAAAAVGRFDDAGTLIETLPEVYQDVARRALARHLTAAARAEEAVGLLGRIADETVAEEALTDVIEAAIARADPDGCRHVAGAANERGWATAVALVAAAGGEPGFGLTLLGGTPPDDLALGFGGRLGRIVLDRGQVDQATAIARRLVPAAERLLGPQWPAPETVGASSEVSAAALGLLSLLAGCGEPLPDVLTPLGMLIETQYGQEPSFRTPLILALATAGRFADARAQAEATTLPHARATGLALALSLAGDGVQAAEREAAAAALAAAADEAPATPTLDSALAGATRALLNGGLAGAARQLVDRLASRAGLWSAIGVLAAADAAAGDPAPVRDLLHRLLSECPLEAVPAGARAELLVALAARPGATGEDLETVVELLGDLGSAALALDVVFEAVDVLGRHRGLDAAGAFARTVADGLAAQVAEALLTSGTVRWEGEPTEDQLAAAAAVRLVAAGGMVLATSRADATPAVGEWRSRMEQLLAQARARAFGDQVAAAVSRYVHTARVVAGEPPQDGDLDEVMGTAALLWDLGLREPATRYARAQLDALDGTDALVDRAGLAAGGTRIIGVEALERRGGVLAATRAVLRSIVALDLAASGHAAAGGEAAQAAQAETGGYGWLALEVAERSVVEAWLALALEGAGDHAAARARLDAAAAPAAVLARRGELRLFGPLCAALVAVERPDAAAARWGGWLIAAAAAGPGNAIQLIAAYLRAAPAGAATVVTAGARQVLAG